MLVDLMSFCEGCLDIADVNTGLTCDVVLARNDRERLVGFPIRMDADVACERLLRIVQCRQILVFNFDGFNRALGDLGGGGSDRGDCMSHEQDTIGCEHGRVAHRSSIADLRDISGGDDPAHAGDRSGARDVDVLDQSVRARTAQDLAVEHTGQLEIRSINVLSGNFADAIPPGQAVTDNAMGLCVHCLAPESAMRSAAVSTASMILR
ncbi:hypothetical protein LRP30_33460 [Bradyrhizobium sp. C-145]|uniref:hypothetical protein n=1 Tax=Bradyrhizobium sp. C-145 TaxID=574727 RepID=UPI00201B623B|nr:hypothetical protein [Bradyrhizobium sp. C-145]UQR68261.1 hypothetical protein LRP30_33460 [Bradyrhizobium sp. C-145]